MIELVMENIGLRISILQKQKEKIYKTHTTLEVIKHKSYEIVEIDAQMDILTRLFATLRDGQNGLKETNESLLEQHTILEEELRQLGE